jgi:L-serine dehydratase
MIAMAAEVHVSAAPAITKINHSYLMPYFKKNSHVEKHIDRKIRMKEEKEVEAVLKSAREEIRTLVASCQPITRTFGDVVVGGSSIAVGSPANMARICHFMTRGEISKIIIELTSDLFVRRAINIPAILMAAIKGSQTDDIKMYKSIMELPEIEDIEINIQHVPEPQVQRIRIEASEKSAYLDSLNRGGGRVGIVNAEPSIEKALAVAKKLGIQIAES